VGRAIPIGRLERVAHLARCRQPRHRVLDSSTGTKLIVIVCGRVSYQGRGRSKRSSATMPRCELRAALSQPASLRFAAR
jgi:hypothetical protein